MPAPASLNSAVSSIAAAGWWEYCRHKDRDRLGPFSTTLKQMNYSSFSAGSSLLHRCRNYIELNFAMKLVPSQTPVTGDGMATAQTLYIFVEDDDGLILERKLFYFLLQDFKHLIGLYLFILAASAILGMAILFFSAKDVMARLRFAFCCSCRNSLVSVFWQILWWPKIILINNCVLFSQIR